MFYDYDEPTDHHLADDQYCLCVLYNPVFYTFITAHPKCIKVWDVCTGKLQSVFRDLCSKDITCICLDKRNRKLFVGNCKGHVFSINIKNGAHMKKFEEHKGDVSSLYYWGEKTILLSASWDRSVRLSDDSTSKPEGNTRYNMDKHKDAVNFIDFKTNGSLCASCSDDNSVIIYNYGSYRQEGILQPHYKVKICKFLNPYNILACADLDGKIYFWGVMPSAAKNELLGCIKDDMESEVGSIENFPIRAMDFDATNKILYTGDEMGNMHRWDLSRLVDKLEKFDERMKNRKNSQYGLTEFKKTLNQFEYNPDLTEEENKNQGNGKTKLRKSKVDKSTTFLTSTQPGDEKAPTSDIEDEKVEKDVFLIERWKAHTDGITWVTFNENPTFIATSSFDKNVYIWNDQCERVGSLVLGHDKYWNIKIDKTERQQREYEEAIMMLDKAENDDTDGPNDKERTEKEQQLKILEQINNHKSRRNQESKF